jgi:dipeptidyl aminopeptidase/acylaminoacyl peptidase
MKALGLFLFVTGLALGSVNATSLVSDYFSEQSYSAYRVSPSGRFVSYMEQDGKITRLHVRDFETNSAYSLETERDSDFGGYVWVDDETIALTEIIFSANDAPKSYISTYSYKLRRLNADFNRPSRLTMGKGHRDIIPVILSGVPAQKGTFLIAEPTVSFRYDSGRVRGNFNAARSYIHRMNVEERETERIVDEPAYDGWLSDSQGRLRVALKLFGKGEGVYHRESDTADWERLDFPEDAMPLGFLPGDELLLMSYVPEGEERVVVQAYNTEAKKWASKPIQDPIYDVTRGGDEMPTILNDPKTGNVIGIRYDQEKPKTLWFDPTYGQVQQMVESVFPDAVVHLHGLVSPVNSVLVQVYSDVIPGVVLLFDLETRELKQFMDTRPSLKNYTFRKIQPISFEARDGATVYGYITLPDGADKTPPPMVVMVKGGPAGRTAWADGLYFFEAQHYSSMGYSLLQVNYRGSTGYGKTYEGEASLFSAQKGVEDVVDATRWAIEQGYADPNRVVLAGASFGGYVSGMAPAVEPDLYQCAVPSMGVYDWLAMIEFDKRVSHPFVWEILKEKYGDYEALEEEYKKWSPAQNADKIFIPIFVMHGIYDTRVDMEQVKLFEKSLRTANADFDTYYYTRGGHGFGSQEGWLDFFAKMDAFIQTHVPAR